MRLPRTNAIPKAPTTASSDPAFLSLVERSIAAWESTNTTRWKTRAIKRHSRLLRSLKTLDDFLTFRDQQYWFFQLREAFLRQKAFEKWSPDLLDDYILLPMGNGFANPSDCVFLSHFWHEPGNPDREGSDLKPIQERLGDGLWSKAVYFWVDFTCLPQGERTEPQQEYFSKALKSIPRLVRDCAFTWQFPQFQPRLWLLFEAAAFAHTRARPISREDMDPFMRHLREMKGYGVRYVVNRHGYRCTNRSDRELIIGWLEILLVLSRLVPSLRTRRAILNAIDNSRVRTCYHEQLGMGIDKKTGLITMNGRTWGFTPVPFDHDVAESDDHVHIPIGSWHERKLREELRKARNAFERGYEEFGRANERDGEYRVAEALFRKALEEERGSSSVCVIVALDFLAGNLEKQACYQEAEKVRRELATLAEEAHGPHHSSTRESKHQLAMTSQNARKAAYFRIWEHEALEKLLEMERPGLPSADRSDAEQAGRADPTGSKEALWASFERSKETLGPYHAKTLRGLLDLAIAFRIEGYPVAAERLFWVALPLSDELWGPEHCDTLAVLSQLAATVSSADKSKETYRQQLERQLRVVDFDHPDTFTVKFNLMQMLDRGETLEASSEGVRIR